MTPLQPPRLALALLTRFVPDNESLVGDLLEEFQSRRSPLWLWRQVLLAIVIGAWRRSFTSPEWGTGPLHLGVSHDGSSYEGPQRDVIHPMTTINMSGIPVCGVGGLGMVATSMLITVVLPQAWWLVLSGVVGGVFLGIARIVSSRRAGLAGPAGGGGSSPLFGAHSLEGVRPASAPTALCHPGGTGLAAVRA